MGFLPFNEKPSYFSWKESDCHLSKPKKTILKNRFSRVKTFVGEAMKASTEIILQTNNLLKVQKKVTI